MDIGSRRQVRLGAHDYKYAAVRGVSGHASLPPPRKYFKIRYSEIVSGAILRPKLAPTLTGTFPQYTMHAWSLVASQLGPGISVILRALVSFMLTLLPNTNVTVQI